MTALTATLAMCLSDLRERHLRCIERAASERDASHEAFLTKAYISFWINEENIII